MSKVFFLRNRLSNKTKLRIINNVQLITNAPSQMPAQRGSNAREGILFYYVTEMTSHPA